MSSFQTYLEARRSVDDRALHDRVFEAFADGVAELAAGNGDPLRIVEVGGGIGTMIARLVERDVFSGSVRYRLIDRDADTIDRAREVLPDWLEAAGCAVERTATGLDVRSTSTRADGPSGFDLEVRLETGDAFDGSPDEMTADAVIGSAVFDLLDLERALSWVESVMRPGGLFYAPLTYDGATRFTPADPFDDRLERLYHRHMDEVRDEPGGSRAGRRLVELLDRDDRPFEVLEVGASEWVLHPHERSPSTASAERVVTRYLLETIDDALSDFAMKTVDPRNRRRWRHRRAEELATGELTVRVRHVDVLARR